MYGEYGFKLFDLDSGDPKPPTPMPPSALPVGDGICAPGVWGGAKGNELVTPGCSDCEEYAESGDVDHSDDVFADAP